MINLPAHSWTEYDVATGSNAHKLKVAVEKARSNGGWDLQGGVAICSNGSDTLIYAQALVKTVTSDTV